MSKLAFNKTNLNRYKEQLIIDIKRKKLSINPKTENGLLNVIKYIDKKGIELSELFNIPTGIEPGDVIELLLSNGDLDSIYTEFELPLEPEEEIADIPQEQYLTVKYLDIFNIDAWKNQPVILNNLRTCIQQLESLTKEEFETLKSIIVTGKEYPLNGGNISASSRMVANSKYGKFLASDILFIEIRINAAGDSAKRRAYGGLRYNKNNKPVLYLSSVYTKNSNANRIDNDFDKLLNRFIVAMKGVNESIMNRWVNDLNNLLAEKSIFESLDFHDLTKNINAEEEGFADSISGVNKNSNNKYYIDGYQYGKKLKEDTKFEYMTQETLDKIKKYRENN